MIRMTRVTTSAALKDYRYNLMHATNNRNDAQNTVLTGRNFNSYAEDPATAAARTLSRPPNPRSPSRCAPL